MKSDSQINESLAKIETLDKILNDLSVHFSEKKSAKITRENIFDALYISLCHKLNWEHPLDFWDLKIKYEEAKKELIDFDFTTVLFKIESSPDILPEDCVMQTKVQIKSKGLIWVIHKYDADPFPSNPHAHQLESGIKLDLKNGKCYRKKEFVRTLKRKDLIAIRDLAEKKFDLPVLEI